MNEPNGLVYNDGVNHLFDPANPFNNRFGNQTWGHATSTDMVHWEKQPAAIPPAGGVLSFSGSAVVDTSNTAGLGAGAIVAACIGFTLADGPQDQRLAHPNDNRQTWTKYAGSPVIPRLAGTEGVESRDRKVLWHEPTSSWKMLAQLHRTVRQTRPGAAPHTAVAGYCIFAFTAKKRRHLATIIRPDGDKTTDRAVTIIGGGRLVSFLEDYLGKETDIPNSHRTDSGWGPVQAI